MSVHILNSIPNDFMEKRLLIDFRGQESYLTNGTYVSLDGIVSPADNFASTEYKTSNSIAIGGPYTSDPLMWVHDSSNAFRPNTIYLRNASAVRPGFFDTYGDRIIEPSRLNVTSVSINPDNVHIDVNVVMTPGLVTETDTFVGGAGVDFNLSNTSWFTASILYKAKKFNFYDPDITTNLELRVNGSPVYHALTLKEDLTSGRPVASYTPESEFIGVVYRVLIQSNIEYPQWQSSSGSIYSEIAFYAIDAPNTSYYTPSAVLPVDDSVHPLVSQMNRVDTYDNVLIVPYGVSFRKIMKLYDMDFLNRIHTGGSDTYRLKAPKYALFPSEYAVNDLELSDDIVTTVNELNTYSYSPFNVYGWTYIDANLSNEFTTETTNLKLFTVGRENHGVAEFSLYVNDVKVEITSIPENITTSGPTLAVNTINVFLDKPYNIVKFYRTKTEFSEFIVRVTQNNTLSNPARTFYENGTFIFEDTPTAEQNYIVSYKNPTATTNYVDAYKNVITPTTPLSNVVLNGPLVETVFTKSGSSLFYGVAQNYWDTSAVTDVWIDEFGYIKTTASAYGQYTIYPTTSKGHVTLTVDVVESPEEFIYYVFKGCQIDVSSKIGGALTFSPHITSGFITATASTKFNVKNVTFEINVLENPPSLPLQINVKSGSIYNLRDVVDLDKRIDSSFYAATGGVGTPNAYVWTSNGTLTVCGLLIANIVPVVLNVTTSAIYARLGRAFNIWDHISPNHTDSLLLNIDAGDDAEHLPDGTVKINSSISSLTVTVMILKIRFSLTITVYILSNNTIESFITKNITITVDKSTLPVSDKKLILVGQSGERVNVFSTYQGSECTISSSPTEFEISKIEQSFLILTNTFEEHFTPIEEIDLSERLLVKNAADKVTISLPRGPMYVISDLALTFFGGDYTFSPGSYNELTVTMPNYNDGNSEIRIKIVTGFKQKIYIVNQRTIENVDPISVVPDYITVNPSEIIVKNSGSITESNILTVLNQGDGKYYEYVFEVLPMIDLSQTLYFGVGDTYGKILPSIGYVYTIDFISTITPGAVSFNYGELSGTFNMVLYQGAAQTVTIYEKFKVPNMVEVHSVSEKKPLILPYINNGVSFQISGSDIDVLKTNPDVDVGQWFFVNSTGEATLYSFDNAPPFSHGDVVIYDPPNTWITDTDMDVTGAFPVSYNVGDTFTYSSNLPFYVATVNYYGTDFTFRITKMSAVEQIVHVVDQTALELTGETIEEISITPPNYVKYNQSASIYTSNAEINLNQNNLKFINSNSDASASASTASSSASARFYVKTDVGMHVFKIVTHAIPVDPIVPVTLELYNDVDLNTYTFVPTLSMGGTNMTIPVQPTFVVGNNTINYEYYGVYSGSFTLKIVLIPVPTGFDTYRILQMGSQETFNILTELFKTSDHILNNVNSFGGLTTTSKQNGDITMSGSIANSYVLVANITLKPTTLLKLAIRSNHDIPIEDRIIQPNITVLVYDPDNVPHKVLRTTVGAGISSSFNGLTFPTPIASGSKLLSVTYNGDNLEGNRHNAINWQNFPTFTVRYDKNTVDDYFFRTDKQFYRITVIVMPSFPVQVTEKIDAPNTTKTTDVLASVFGQEFADRLYEIGVNISYQTYLLNAGVNSIPVDYIETPSTILLTTLNIQLVSVPAPITTGQTSFVMELNKPFELKSSSVSTSGKLQVVTETNNVFNDTNGITAFYTIVGTYSVSCTLTNDSVTSVNVNIEFIVYDPAEAIAVNINSYTGSGVYTLVHDAVSYSVDGANFGLVPSLYCSISGLNVTMNAMQDKPRHIIIIYMNDLHPMENKSIVIITFTLITVDTNQAKFYIEKDQDLVLTVSDVAMNSITRQPIVTGTLQFDPFGYILGIQGYEFLTTSGIVGYANNSVSSVTLTGGSNVGVWENLSLDVTVGSETTKVFPYVETLGTLTINTDTIFTEVNKKFVIDADDFVVPGIEVNFNTWQLNSGSVPSYITINNNILSGTFTSIGKYTFSANATSKKKSSISLPFTFDVIVMDSTISSTVEIVLEELITGTLTIPGIVKSVSTIPNSGVTIQTSIDTFLDTTLITAKAIKMFLGSLTYTMILESGETVVLIVSQISKSKPITLIGANYSGNLFPNQIRSVLNYTVTQLGGTYNPNTTYTLPGGGSIYIASNGDYNVTVSNEITIIATYENGTVTLDINGNKSKQILVNQPSHTETVGSNVKVNGLNLSNGKSIKLTYGTFSLKGETLNISEIQNTFEPTLVTYETETSTEIIISDLLFILDTSVNEVNNLKVDKNTNLISFILPFTPSKVIHDEMSFNGSSSNFDVYDPCSCASKLANVKISGNIINLVTYNQVGISKPITVIDGTGKKVTYYRIEVLNAVQSINVFSTQVINAPTGLIFQILGDNVGQLFGNGILNGKVKNVGSSIEIMEFTISDPYKFYATLSNGTIMRFELNFEVKELQVSDLTRIPKFLAVGFSSGIVTFKEPNLSADAKFINNSTSLRTFTIKTPVYKQINLTLI